MFVEFKDNSGKKLTVNSDQVVFLRPAEDGKLIGHVELIMGMQITLQGAMAIQQLVVQGTLVEVTRKLNGESVPSIVN